MHSSFPVFRFRRRTSMWRSSARAAPGVRRPARARRAVVAAGAAAARRRQNGEMGHGELRDLLVEPGAPPRLDDRDPDVRFGAPDKEAGLVRLAELTERLGVLHYRLQASASRALLLVLQGMDASGKDGTIRHVLSGVSPQGCRVVSFREPTSTELGHDFLWRVHAECPARGEMAIFNRSHYEDVVAVRVRGLLPEEAWRPRYGHIRHFEKLLSDEGTSIVKVFLQVSKKEQRRRLQERLDDPEKRWKFRIGDLEDRARWDDYVSAYEDAIRETSTEGAPWFVVPADHNWSRNLAVAEILVEILERLDLQLPDPDPDLDDVVVS
jgi:PPK2 family polyphosphate:nucleotide phosphotransferase